MAVALGSVGDGFSRCFFLFFFPSLSIFSPLFLSLSLSPSLSLELTKTIISSWCFILTSDFCFIAQAG